MVVETDEYVGGPDAEKEPVAIINPDNLDNEAEQLQDLPLASDCKNTKTSPATAPANSG